MLEDWLGVDFLRLGRTSIDTIANPLNSPDLAQIPAAALAVDGSGRMVAANEQVTR